MPFNYDPKDAADCLPEGEYDAELGSVEETESKRGNPMLLAIWIVSDQGRTFRIREYIVNPGGIYKLKQIARAWQLLGEFEAGTFDLQEHIGKLIRVRLDVESSPNFPDKNTIVAYAEASFEAQTRPAKPAMPDDDELIPF